jgi:hypothetical protein
MDQEINVGKLERWNDGIMEIPLIHFSIIPSTIALGIHYSIISS